jgi:hypothetical protein
VTLFAERTSPSASGATDRTAPEMFAGAAGAIGAPPEHPDITSMVHAPNGSHRFDFIMCSCDLYS